MGKSIASRVESNSGVGLPVGFSGGGDVIQVGDPLYQSTPYALFVSTRGQSFAQIAAKIPDLQDGDPVLVRPNVDPLRLNPFRFFLIAAFQHFSVVDTQGTIVKSTRNPEWAKSHTNDKWNEHVETVLVVVTPDELVPCRCTFKTTKCRAVYKAIETRRQAENPELWGMLSQEHKASLVAPEPWARYVCTVTLKRATSKSSGFAYVAADSFVVPTGVADWKRLADYFAVEANKANCDAVMAAHAMRTKLVTDRLEDKG